MERIDRSGSRRQGAPESSRNRERAPISAPCAKVRLQHVPFVKGSGAKFLLSDCQRNADLLPELGSLLRPERKFGCVTVYSLRN